jgi:hypothetical protein
MGAKEARVREARGWPATARETCPQWAATTSQGKEGVRGWAGSHLLPSEQRIQKFFSSIFLPYTGIHLVHFSSKLIRQIDELKEFLH